MRPELFRLFAGTEAQVSVPAYFAMLLVGFAFATAIAVLRARRLGENPDVIVDLALASLLMGVVGGRIFHVLFDGHFMEYVHLCTDPSLVDWPISKARCLEEGSTEQLWCASERAAGVWDAVRGVCHPKETDCWAWAKFWAGGLTYYGGLLAASASGIYLLRRDRFPVWKGVDLAALGIPVGLGFGRMGCTLAGCCFGQPTTGPLALSFPAYSPASTAQHKLGLLESAASPSLPVYPTQIYESAMCFAVAAVCLFYVQGRKRYDGQVFVAFLVLYALGRFALEFLRADDRGGLLHLSTSQLLGLAIIAAAFALHRYRLRSMASAVEQA